MSESSVNTGSKPEISFFKTVPTSSVLQARLQLFQPTRRPKWQERVIKTSWGNAIVRGKIGQVHADIIETMCRHSEDHRIFSGTMQLQLLVDPHRLRMIIGGGKQYPADTLQNNLNDLRDVSITLEVPSRKMNMQGGILNRVEESPATRTNRVTGKPRHLWRVTLDPAFSGMLCEDIGLYYDPAPLAKLRYGIAQAVARHILTHRDVPTGGWLVDNLIHAVGAGGDSVSMRHRRHELIESKESLKTVGIVLMDGRLYKGAGA